MIPLCRIQNGFIQLRKRVVQLQQETRGGFQLPAAGIIQDLFWYFSAKNYFRTCKLVPEVEQGYSMPAQSILQSQTIQFCESGFHRCHFFRHVLSIHHDQSLQEGAADIDPSVVLFRNFKYTRTLKTPVQDTSG